MALINYRLNPFNDTLDAVTITNETHIISSSSPFTIQLCEAPKKDAPSTINLKISGVTAQEVAASPAQGQFWPDYSTNADGNERWNTGTILFNSADAGRIVSVTYQATGSIVWADAANAYYFWESGSIVAPNWARYVFLSGCAGGGGGGGRGAAGAAGGITSFGNLLSLGGGGGGGRIGSIVNPAHGTPGVNGSSRAGLVPAGAGYYIDRFGEVQHCGGAGGSNPFGQGGSALYTITGDGGSGRGRGQGGSGAFHNAQGGGGGGGAGGACISERITIEKGRKYEVTIGAGGVGGGGAQKGGDGWTGFLMVRWGA